ncbi:MAG: TerC family protein [Deltaproteobacteria bacterium]|nr:MAG: TerC family protein [Deltaproteobacteria bacterium]
MDALLRPEPWIAFATLTALEIVLGIDNIVFIAILSGRLPRSQQARAYRLGLGAAMLSRIALLLALSWVMGLTDPLFEVLGRAVSGHDLILVGGGLFLMAKSAIEIFDKVEGGPEDPPPRGGPGGLAAVVGQIMALDVVFSLDSVITAVGMVEELWVMIAAIVAAVLIMLLFAQRIGDFVNRHPSMKLLALSFLLMIGVLLVAEGLGAHLNRGYVYFAMGYAVCVELLKLRWQKRQAAGPGTGAEGTPESTPR